ncbi:hypothetical protein HO133_003652 [Letharia lupina]|uniref:Uncharacterized protein n=1 Tax=Letharia lupina TaxID=560253 RepID=A0A8H6CA99_9LECA|nr:uncharacterized protein HO133_003652 [Letharia lupina]KAF6219827.1 hypothetical protein HO133_003652 [Letharia lupina]
MGDSSSNAAHAEMQCLVLQPFPRVPPLNGLSREQKLAYAAYHLEQHEQSMKDKIRETALCAQEYADDEAGPGNSPQNIRQEPRPDELRAAMRLGWKSHKPKPVVRTSRRSQPVFGVPPSSEHVGIAKRAIEELDSFDANFQPTLSAIQRAQDSRNAGNFSGTNGAPTPIASDFPPSRQVEREVNYDATRDPRVGDPRALS